MVAPKASYLGSPEHKDTPSFVGEPRPRADASICDRSLRAKKSLLTRWLRTAIRKGVVSELWIGGYPRYVWYKHGDTVYEGMLLNKELGQYKGYPLERDEWPSGIDDYYE